MSIFELIGLIIAFFSFFYMMSFRKGQPEEEGKRAKSPVYDYDDDDEEDEDPLVKLLATFEQKSIKKEKQSPKLSTPIQKRKTEKQHHLRPVKAKPLSPIPEFEDRSHKGIQPHRDSRARKMIRTLPHRQNLVVYQEIIGKPIGLRSQEWQ